MSIETVKLKLRPKLFRVLVMPELFKYVQKLFFNKNTNIICVLTSKVFSGDVMGILEIRECENFKKNENNA